MNLRPRILGASIGALAALAVGGAGLAWAQETPTTPPTEAPAADAPAPGEEAPASADDCPHGDDGASGTGSTATDEISL